MVASQENIDSEAVETVKCRLLVSRQNTSGYSFISTLNAATGTFNVRQFLLLNFSRNMFLKKKNLFI